VTVSTEWEGKTTVSTDRKKIFSPKIDVRNETGGGEDLTRRKGEDFSYHSQKNRRYNRMERSWKTSGSDQSEQESLIIDAMLRCPLCPNTGKGEEWGPTSSE